MKEESFIDKEQCVLCGEPIPIDSILKGKTTCDNCYEHLSTNAESEENNENDL